MEPSCSIVIASAAGGEFLFQCLGSIAQQAKDVDAEIIVVDRAGAKFRERIEREFPDVRVLTADETPRLSVPSLRLRGVEAATSELVCVLEEHCAAPPDWLKVIRSNFTDGDNALGGPILDDNFKRIRDWVVYFSEYNNYLPPWADGPHANLNGANIAYRKEAVLAESAALNDGYWEVVLHPALQSSGSLRAVNAMGVRHTGPFDFGYYLHQRYLLSRVWGGSQRARVSMTKRLIYLMVAPLLPCLLLARTASRVSQSNAPKLRFLISIPLLIPVAVTYVWGEWLGYLLGAGSALERVE